MPIAGNAPWERWQAFCLAGLFLGSAYSSHAGRLLIEAGKPDPAHADASLPPLTIGLLLPPEEAEAESLRRGAEIGLEQANRDLGVRAKLLVRGRFGQWGTDGEEAASMVLDEGVRGLITPPGGAPAHLALQVSGRTATPVISLCADSSVLGAGIPWLVRLVPGTQAEAGLLVASVKRVSASQDFHWCALVPPERPGREAASDLAKAAAKAGGLLDKTMALAPLLGNWNDLCQDLLVRKPDGILLWLDPVVAGKAVKSLRQAGYGGVLAGPSHLQGSAFGTEAGSAAEGFLLPAIAQDEASQAVRRDFEADFQVRHGTVPDVTAARARDAVALLLAGLSQAGEDSFRAFPPAHSKPGASGPLQFERGGNRVAKLELLEFQNGRFGKYSGK